MPDYVDDEMLKENSVLVAEAKRLGRWMIILSNLVPVSLLLTLEFVRFAQALFIAWDVEMCDEHRQAIVNESCLNEQLGKIDYVFTDKTGTLTLNKLEVQRVWYTCKL